MADRHFRSLFRALHLRREQWTFLLMALLCVSVIVGTALWTRQAEFARVTPTRLSPATYPLRSCSSSRLTVHRPPRLRRQSPPPSAALPCRSKA